jgi:hypothetical protein
VRSRKKWSRYMKRSKNQKRRVKIKMLNMEIARGKIMHAK